MEPARWQERIVVSPELRHGEACIRGTRIPVSVIVGSLAEGFSFDQVKAGYPQLTDDDIRAALAYAADAVQLETLLPLP